MSSDELIREVEEDMRRERAQKLWRDFGKLMVGASLVIILITIGVVVSQDMREKEAMQQTASLLKAIDLLKIENYVGAIAAFDAMAADKSSPYYGIAMMRKAQAQIGLKDMQSAEKTYAELAAGRGEFAELARLHVKGGEMAEPAKDAAFATLLAEWKAWEELAAGKQDAAVLRFADIQQNPATTPAQRQRIALVLARLSPKEAADGTHAQ